MRVHARLFCSVLRGDADEHSDIDLAVDRVEGVRVNPLRVLELSSELEERYGRTVQVVVLGGR